MSLRGTTRGSDEAISHREYYSKTLYERLLRRPEGLLAMT